MSYIYNYNHVKLYKFKLNTKISFRCGRDELNNSLYALTSPAISPLTCSGVTGQC